MTDTQSLLADWDAARERQAPAAAPASIGEIWNANWDAAGLSTLGAGKSFGDARSDIVAGIEGAAGMPLGQYARQQGLPLGAAGTPDENIRELTDIAGTLPEDAQKRLAPLLDWRRNAQVKAATIERTAADVNAAAYGLGPNAVRFAAGLARSSVDPLNLAAMAVTAPIGGEAALPLWQVLARQALAGGAAQLLQEPSIQATRGELGLEHGAGMAAEDVMGAAAGNAAFAGGLTVLLRGGAMALRMVRRSRPGAPGEISATPAPGGAEPLSESPSPVAGHPAAPLAPADLEAAARLTERDQTIEAAAPPLVDQVEHGHQVDEAAAALEEGRPIEVYHGSPHDFERFDASQIGTGEGAQSYGHGLYFAQNEAVARSYQLMSDATVGGRPFDVNDPVHKAVSLVDEFGSREAAIGETKARIQHDPGDFYSDVLRHLESDRPLPTLETGGRVYKVQIKANPDHFLDWDKPIGEQSPYVQERAKALLEKHAKPEAKAIIKQRGVETLTGKEVHDAIAFRGAKGLFAEQDRPTASNVMRDAGIAGIKYLDEGSRDIPFRVADEVAINGGPANKSGPFYVASRALDREAGPFATREEARAWIAAKHEETATRNFVVFDDRLLNVIEKNGTPVKPLSDMPLPKEAHLAPKEAPSPPSPTKAGEGAAAPRAGAKLEDTGLAADAGRVLEEAGGDFQIRLDENAEPVSAREALAGIDEEATAARELAACAAMEIKQ